MDNALILIVLAIVVLAIVGLQQFFRRKPDAENAVFRTPLAHGMSLQSSGTHGLISAQEIDAKPFTRWLCDQACAQTGIDLRQDPMALTRIADAGAKAQSDFATSDKVEINLPYVTADASGPKHFNLTVDRHEVNRLGLRMV